MKGRHRQKPPAPALHRAPPHGPDRGRWLIRDTADQTLTIGLPRPWLRDLYHQTLRMGWWAFLLLGGLLYVALNIGFALLYLMQPGAIANARPGSFADAFFFSVQTVASIGYGQMYPATIYANLVMTVEAASGLLILALATGLVFARFSRPTARILFSRVAVIGPHNGRPTLSFRLANQRRNQILQAEVTANLLRDEETAEGVMLRRFYELKLQRHRTPVMAMTFTVLHEIDEDSPLSGATAVSLAAINAELVVTATGIDETSADPVHARASYLPDEILWDHRFVDVIGWTDDGSRVIDYRRFHDTVPFASAP
jgi:inward rectifier potassium channel